MSGKEKLKIKITKHQNKKPLKIVVNIIVKNTTYSELVTFATHTYFSVKIYVFPKSHFY